MRGSCLFCGLGTERTVKSLPRATVSTLLLGRQTIFYASPGKLRLVADDVTGFWIERDGLALGLAQRIVRQRVIDEGRGSQTSWGDSLMT
jgi:hypothetical protein